MAQPFRSGLWSAAFAITWPSASTREEVDEEVLEDEVGGIHSEMGFSLGLKFFATEYANLQSQNCGGCRRRKPKRVPSARLGSRLVLLFPKIDVDPADSFVSENEFIEWNLQQAMKEVHFRRLREMEIHDKNNNGLLSFAEYEAPNWMKNAIFRGRAGVV